MRNPVSRSAELGKVLGVCLAPHYLRRPRLWSRRLLAIDRRVAVSLTWGFTYVRIPKAANTTVIQTLMRYCPEDEARARRSDDGDPAKRYFRRLSSLSRAEARQVRTNHFTFTFVRNPFHRILSAYLNKLVHGSATGPQTPESFRRRIRAKDDGELSFRGFCRYLAEGGVNEDCHWLPQSRLVEVVGVDRLDHIGRVEALAMDLHAVLTRIHGTDTARTIDYAGPPPTHAASRCATHYDDECVDIVRTLYAKDFDSFGYSDRTY